ncbi:MAG: hypothetical protein FJY85_10690 [Deltaproteobacteria bacterium]|nr:hypothetical protein [Deltaproteobacteria bacterium]
MKRSYVSFATAAALLLFTAGLGVASNIDKNIQDLKSQDPEVRAQAAYDLGCG